MGPNAPIGHGSVFTISEEVARYIITMLRKCQTEAVKVVAIQPQAAQDFTDHSRAFLPRTVWATSCRSWYKNGTSDGPIIALHPGSRSHWFHMMETFRPEDYEFKYFSKNRFQFLGNGFSVKENGPNTTWYLDRLAKL